MGCRDRGLDRTCCEIEPLPLSGRWIEAVHRAVVGADHHHPLCERRGRNDRPPGLNPPALLACPCVEPVDVPVLAAEDHSRPRDDWSARDVIPGLEGPEKVPAGI